MTSPKITPEEILQAIAQAIPSQTIAVAIERTQSERQRNRKLPTHLVVALIIAMSLWSKDFIEIDGDKNEDGLEVYSFPR